MYARGGEIPHPHDGTRGSGKPAWPGDPAAPGKSGAARKCAVNAGRTSGSSPPWGPGLPLPDQSFVRLPAIADGRTEPARLVVDRRDSARERRERRAEERDLLV